MNIKRFLMGSLLSSATIVSGMAYANPTQTIPVQNQAGFNPGQYHQHRGPENHHYYPYPRRIIVVHHRYPPYYFYPRARFFGPGIHIFMGNRYW